MTLAKILRDVADDEQYDVAKSVAAILNADRLAVDLQEARSGYTAEDVIRLGHVISAYIKPPSVSLEENFNPSKT